MSKISQKWIEDGAVNADKVDLADSYDWSGEHDFTTGAARVAAPTEGASAVPWSLILEQRHKEPVRVRAQGNVDLSAPGATIDGETMVEDDRVLCDQQTTTTQDGVYLWKGASTPMVRTDDFSAGLGVSMAVLGVQEGTDALKRFEITNEAGSDVVGTDDLIVRVVTGEPERISNVMSTCLASGGAISVNANPTKFDVAAGSGWIVNNYTDPASPTRTYVSWAAFTAQTDNYLASADITYVFVNSSGALVQLAAWPAESYFADYIYLGANGHPSRSYISYITNNPVPGTDISLQFRQFVDVFGGFNIDGNIVGANGANLKMDRSAGSVHYGGINFHTDKRAPNIRALNSSAQFYFIYAYRDTGGNWTSSSPGQNADPNYYDPGGGAGKTAVTSTYWTLQKIFFYPQIPLVVIQYGQAQYATKTEAENALNATFTLDPDLDKTIFRGTLLVKQGATVLNDTSYAVFYPASKFGLLSYASGGGGGGGGEANTASNIGTSGTGLFNSKVGVDLQFKNLKAASTKISVTDNPTPHTVDVDVVPGNVAHQDLSGAGTNTHANIDTHIANTSNPHSVTKTQVGLSNVTNDAQIKASDFPASSTDSRFALMSGAGGKAIKEATFSGLAKATSGVAAAATFNQELVTTQTITNADTAITDTLNATPLANASVRLYLNGVLQEQGAGKDYTISGTTITWLASSGTAVDMDTSDVLIAEYIS